MENLLKIDEMMQSVEKFIPIKFAIESLDESDPNYQKLVEQTDLLVKILTAFSGDNTK